MPERGVSRARSQATLRALQREGSAAASPEAIGRQTRLNARKRGKASLQRAAEKAARTMGPQARGSAAKKAARTRARRAGG